MATFSTNHMYLVEAYKREGFTSADALSDVLIQDNNLLKTATILSLSYNSYHDVLVVDKLGYVSFKVSTNLFNVRFTEALMNMHGFTN